jgi:hypothetical protein
MNEASEGSGESELFGAGGKGAKGEAEERKEERKKDFLNIISEDDLKRKQNDSLDDLRKNKR